LKLQTPSLRSVRQSSFPACLAAGSRSASPRLCTKESRNGLQQAVQAPLRAVGMEAEWEGVLERFTTRKPMDV